MARIRRILRWIFNRNAPLGDTMSASWMREHVYRSGTGDV
jgi:hypothetical protein